jgi:Tol biopolymer transport system component
MMVGVRAVRRRGYLLPVLIVTLIALIGPEPGPATPAQEWIAFTGSDTHGTSGANIELLTLDGSQRLNLTQSRTLNQQRPSWSPDGQRIAFDGGNVPQIRIYTINADGSGLRRVTGPRPGWPAWPSWSPDGRWIAFLANGRVLDTVTVYRIRPDGSRLHEWRFPGRPYVTARGGAVPVWSPDGERVAFSETVVRRGSDGRLSGQLEIFTAYADGRALKRLTFSPKDDLTPAWSPDGTKIAFTSNRSARDGRQNDIYVMNADGRSRRD